MSAPDLRLVGGNFDWLSPPKKPQSFELLVIDPASGRELLKIVLQSGNVPDTPLPMRVSVSTPGDQQDAVSVQPVAGRIDASPGELVASIEAWAQELRRLNLAKHTISQYRRFLLRFVSRGEFSRFDQLKYDPMMDALQLLRVDSDWSDFTYNRSLSCLRNFTKYLRKTKRLSEDVLEEACGTKPMDEEDGARAATTLEARRFIAMVAAKVAGRRNYSDRLVQAMTQFCHACRSGEPARLEWKRHMFLDAPVPYIRWTKDINKNRRQETRAIAPELLPLLLAHRDKQREIARRDGPTIQRLNRKTGEKTTVLIDPDADGSMVFPRPSPPCQFKKDANSALIQIVDNFGKSFSGHSSRKWFETTLINGGVPNKLVDKLLRHRGKTEDRYYDPTLEDQAGGLAKLPLLLPDGWIVDNRSSTGNSPRSDLTSDRTSANMCPSTPTPHQSINPNQSAGPSGQCRSGKSTPSYGPRIDLGQTWGSRAAPGVESGINLQSESGLSGIAPDGLIRVDADWLRETLLMLARLLPPGAGHGKSG